MKKYIGKQSKKLNYTIFTIKKKIKANENEETLSFTVKYQYDMMDNIYLFFF